ncbi:PfkB family carbohydrate kinase [Micromonospora okii]|uniref:PfkB family carbohydrate kinase n=1 Tax=Micromonospora okii TaxID=1182970 RepID=UPI001E4F58E4|nr:PfkB family carbohydrate kinase [Micromonospora okii]
MGRSNIDITVRIPGPPVPGRTTFASSPATTTAGGKSLNQALAASRAGAHATLIANAGDDYWGTFLYQTLIDAAVDVSRFHLVPSALTGIALIEVDPDGENRIILARAPETELTGEQVRGKLAGLPAAVVVTQLDLQPDAVDAVVRHHRAQTLIGNLVPHPTLGSAALGPLDLFVANEAEAAAILGRHHDDPIAAARELRTLGPRAVVVTAGPRGAAYSDAHDTALIPAPHVNVTNTSGAGDTFLGTVAARLAYQLPLSHAVADGVAAATTFVQQ